jgi:hypothetical protein
VGDPIEAIIAGTNEELGRVDLTPAAPTPAAPTPAAAPSP